MSFPILCAECGHAMLPRPDYDVCVNGACEWQGVEIPNDAEDGEPLDWLEGLTPERAA